MKKITSILLVLTMVLSLVPVMAQADSGIAAAPINNPTINISSVNTKSGSTANVEISLEANPGIISMRLYLEYDRNAMALTDVTDTGLFPGQVHCPDLSSSEYILFWDNGDLAENLYTEGTVAILTFDIYTHTAMGTYPINIYYDYYDSDILNASLEPVNFEVVPGEIGVDLFTYGDVNEDDRINPLDSSILSRYLANWDNISINLMAADVNNDGNINPLDSSILKRHLANWDGYETLPYGTTGGAGGVGGGGSSGGSTPAINNHRQIRLMEKILEQPPVHSALKSIYAAIDRTLNMANTIELTPEYVHQLCAAEIDEAHMKLRSLYTPELEKIMHMLRTAYDDETLNFLKEYFLYDWLVIYETSKNNASSTPSYGGGGGGGGGGSSVAPEGGTTECFDNTEILLHLQLAYTQLCDAAHFTTSQSIVLAPFLTAIKTVIANPPADRAISKEYFYEVAASDMEEYRTRINAMASQDRDELMMLFANTLDADTIDFLMDYFPDGIL